MFKKIHSNRDPRDTLYSELKKEFSVYVDKGNGIFKHLLCNHPRSVFVLMISSLITSLIFAVTLHAKLLPKEQARVTLMNKPAPVSEGFDRISAAGTALKQTIRLRQQVDSITAKKSLSKTDSIVLLRDLDSLQHIRIN